MEKPSSPSEPREPLTQERSSPLARKPPTDFAKLARRLTWWATNGLATGVIVVLALASGREIIEWWKGDDPRPPADEAAASIGLTGRQIHFGNGAATAQTKHVLGDAATAERALIELCREATLEKDAGANATETGAGEQRLLAMIAGQAPLETHGTFRIDKIPAGVPMLAVSQNVLGKDAAGRLAALAIAIPSGREWGLYLFRAGWTQSSEKSAVAGILLPPNAEISLSVADERGTTLTAIHGRGKLEDWEQFFRKRPSGDPWRLSADWQTAARRRQLVLASTENDSSRCDVQLGEGGGRLWGLITMHKPATAAKTNPSEQNPPPTKQP